MGRISLDDPAASIGHVLGGEWRYEGDAPCFVVERRVRADSSHGRVKVGDMAAQLETSATCASWLAEPNGARPVRPPFTFFDLENTGLSGGAGTYAFVVGCGRFAEDGTFLRNQYVLANYSDERPMLEKVAHKLARAGALVSFNGKSFDRPVLETRYLFHWIDWEGARLPHVDVLHAARRFWGNLSVARAPEEGAPQDEPSCSLTSLESQVLGAGRVADVPGFEIRQRYFWFLRSGDARPLAAVIEHNRLDLLSLAGLTGRLLQLMAEGPAEVPKTPVKRWPWAVCAGGPGSTGAHATRLPTRWPWRGTASRRERSAIHPPSQSPRFARWRSPNAARDNIRPRRPAGDRCSECPPVRRSPRAKPTRRWPFTTSIASAICQGPESLRSGTLETSRSRRDTPPRGTG